MKRFLQIAGAIYIVFALITAHTALAPSQKALANGARDRSEVVASPHTIRNHQRLDFTDSRATDRATDRAIEEKAPIDRENYTIEVWTASWCRPCQIWKRRELPALLILGYDVVIRDIDKEQPPDDVNVVPTVRLYYKGDYVTQRAYWMAIDIEKFVRNRMSLKK